MSSAALKGNYRTTLGIIAYDSHAKVYTSFYASSAGLVGTGIGSVNGNTWTWMVEDRIAGQCRQRKNDNHDVIAH